MEKWESLSDTKDHIAYHWLDQLYWFASSNYSPCAPPPQNKAMKVFFFFFIACCGDSVALLCIRQNDSASYLQIQVSFHYP